MTTWRAPDRAPRRPPGPGDWLLGYAVRWHEIATPMSGRQILFTPRSLAGWVAGGNASDLLVNHAPTYDTWAPRTVGAARKWFSDDYGLAVLCELDPAHSDAIRRAVADGTLTGLSAGVSHSEEFTDWWASPDGAVVPEIPAGAGIPELSVVDQPGCPGARVVATGSPAAQLWETRDLIAYHALREWPAARACTRRPAGAP